MKNRREFLIALLAASAGLGACASAEPAPPLSTPVPQRDMPLDAPAPVEQAPTATAPAEGGPRPVARGEISPALVDANNRFGLKLFANLRDADAAGNVFISPVSVAIALAMTYNGAAGETQQAMARALELNSLSLDEVNQSYAALLQTLATADPKVTLSIANSLWGRQDVAFKQDFLARVRLFYEAEVSALDFSDPATVDTINAWVNEKTNRKIPRILDRISDDAILFLINAIYFKGAWVKAFDPQLTREQPFILSDGSQKQVPMMSRSGEFRYLRGEDFQAVSLPFGAPDTASRFSMLVFLPDESSSLDALTARLTAEQWATWMAQFGPAEGFLAMPRYTLEYEAGLNGALTALDMGVAFDPQQADFGPMVDLQPENVFISSVMHKTFIEVNEEGAEAAAVTSVEMGVTSVREQPERFTMIVERPFLVAIRDDQSGAVLFIGAIVAP
ncbi:MAG: serpin family protein [Candidatus Roseilinea sp.]|uniref:serpin family protein n=1 Tax=Candidatus Roseilinea sp. TaxID=2838777 RepID=UPI004049EFAE